MPAFEPGAVLSSTMARIDRRPGRMTTEGGAEPALVNNAGPQADYHGDC